MRVGFFTECYRPIVNGVVASVEALAASLRSRGHEVYLFTPKVPGYTEVEGGVVRMPSLPLPVDTPYRLTLPHVSRRNVNDVVRRLSIIHAHSPFVTGWMGMRYAKRFNIPLVYTYHTQLEAYAHYVPFERDTTRRAASSLTRMYSNGAAVVVVPTAAMQDHLRAIGVSARIEVVPSGIELGLFATGRRRDDVRARYGASPTDRLALFVSRLAREKNVELLIEAFARVNDGSRLVLVGDGPARESLQALARQRGAAGRITFAGAQPRAALPDLYASADVFVFPSTSETQGLVLVEALAAGCPILAVDTPQTRDVLGTDAIFVPNDATQLAQQLAKMGVPPGHAAREASSQAAQRFAIGLQTDRMLEVYENLLREPALAN